MTHFGTREVATPPANLSDVQMREIWTEVSGHFYGFDVDVATGETATLEAKFLRVCVGGDGLWTGVLQSGTAMVNSYANTPTAPVYVFSDRLLRKEKPFKAIACQISHEAGHAYNLLHQSKWEGNKFIKEYSDGGPVRAPIMGLVDPWKTARWWRGRTKLGTIQDDRELLALALGRRQTFTPA